MDVDTDPRTGSGRGGSLGTPGDLPAEEPASEDQERNSAVSGGGVVESDSKHAPKDEDGFD